MTGSAPIEFWFACARALLQAMLNARRPRSRGDRARRICPSIRILHWFALGVPVADTALPGGYDRAEVAKRIELWREAAA